MQTITESNNYDKLRNKINNQIVDTFKIIDDSKKVKLFYFLKPIVSDMIEKNEDTTNVHVKNMIEYILEDPEKYDDVFTKSITSKSTLINYFSILKNIIRTEQDTFGKENADNLINQYNHLQRRLRQKKDKPEKTKKVEKKKDKLNTNHESQTPKMKLRVFTEMTEKCIDHLKMMYPDNSMASHFIDDILLSSTKEIYIDKIEV